MSLLVILGFGSLAFGLALAAVVGGLSGPADHRRGQGHPRKVFHLGVFLGAVPALLLGGFWGTVIYGSVISSIILGSLWQGRDLPFLSGLARAEEYRAHPVRSILVPLASTAFGGLAAVLLVGRFAAVGFLVCGLGDAAGEPVGRVWGRHRYRAFPWMEEASTRTLEGSLAVFVAGTVGAAVGLGIMGFSLPEALSAGLACGAVGALGEGLSGGESDNFWVQVLSSLVAWWLLG